MSSDRQHIVDVCVRYALSLDQRDWAGLRACFTADAVAEYEGVGTLEGYEAIESTCRAALEPLTASQHLLGNHLVTLGSDGSTAAATCYFQAQHVLGADLYTVAGRYDDDFVRTEAGWRIGRRVLSVAWTAGNPSVLDRG